jgi:DNA invertase Pin-like site-specific DNA recombinase
LPQGTVLLRRELLGCGLDLVEPPDSSVACARTGAEVFRERVRAGIAQARKEGRSHGRPRTASLKADEILGLKAERVSHSEIARRLVIGRTSVRRILRDQ